MSDAELNTSTNSADDSEVANESLFEDDEPELGFWGHVLSSGDAEKFEYSPPDDRVLRISSACIELDNTNHSKNITVQVVLHKDDVDTIIAVLNTQNRPHSNLELFLVETDDVQISLKTIPANASVKVHLSGYLSFFSGSAFDVPYGDVDDDEEAGFNGYPSFSDALGHHDDDDDDDDDDEDTDGEDEDEETLALNAEDSDGNPKIEVVEEEKPQPKHKHQNQNQKKQDEKPKPQQHQQQQHNNKRKNEENKQTPQSPAPKNNKKQKDENKPATPQQNQKKGNDNKQQQQKGQQKPQQSPQQKGQPKGQQSPQQKGQQKGQPKGQQSPQQKGQQKGQPKGQPKGKKEHTA